MDSLPPPSDDTAEGRPVDEPRLMQPDEGGDESEDRYDVDDYGVLDEEPPEDLVLPNGWAERFTFEGKAKEEHDAAIKADAEILLSLQLHKFEERPWADQERRFIAYGRRYLPGLIRKGRIFVMMRALGIPGAHTMALPNVGLPMTIEESKDLAEETIAKAIGPYKKVLMSGRWKPDVDNAAQLTSFFMGQCCWQFRAPWRRYLRERDRAFHDWQHEQAEGELLMMGELSDRFDPARAAVIRLEITRAYDFLDDPIDQQILELTLAGYTAAEVGRGLALTDRQVEYRLKVITKRINQLKEADSLRGKAFGAA